MATHSSIDESVPRQGIKDSGIVCVSLKFAIVISVIQVHSTASHKRTDTLSLLGVKIAVFPSATWKGPRCVAWALGCRRLRVGWRESANPREPPRPTGSPHSRGV